MILIITTIIMIISMRMGRRRNKIIANRKKKKELFQMSHKILASTSLNLVIFAFMNISYMLFAYGCCISCWKRHPMNFIYICVYIYIYIYIYIYRAYGGT